MTHSEDVNERLQAIEADPEFRDWLVESGWIDGDDQEMAAAHCAWIAARRKYGPAVNA